MPTTASNFMPDARDKSLQLPNPFTLAGLIEPGIRPALGGIMNLATDINQFNQDELLSQLETAAPGIRGATGKAAGNITDFLSGIIPKDVRDQIQRQGAFGSVMGGFGGGAQFRNLVARDLGKTSLDLMMAGGQMLNQFSGAVKDTMTAPLYDVGVNIPTLSDLYNAASSQVMVNSNDLASIRALNAAQSAASSFGGGGGRSFSVSQGMPNLGRSPGFQAIAGGGTNSSFVPSGGGSTASFFTSSSVPQQTQSNYVPQYGYYNSGGGGGSYTPGTDYNPFPGASGPYQDLPSFDDLIASLG